MSFQLPYKFRTSHSRQKLDQ
uniref:Uncharacterized protein n=1 Tax=Rhizophora mucronata TaxID=61149 RepID=A0A2P2N5V1_RHIMU